MDDLCSEFQTVDIITLEDLLLTGKIVLEAYKKLKDKKCRNTKEDFLTLMVRKSQIDQVDELEVLTNTSDPN